MAKFCGKCGSPIDQATGKCPNCEPVAVASTAPVCDENAVQTNNESKPKRKKKLVPVIAIILVVAIILGGGVFAWIWFFGDKDYSAPGKDYFVSNKYGDFYLTTHGLINIEDAKDGPLYFKAGKDYKDVIKPYKRTVQTEDSLYYISGDNPEILKLELSDKRILDGEIWMDKEELADALSKEFGAIPAITMWDWQYSDGYIYFVISRQLDFLASNLDYAEKAVYRIGRIDIEDKSIEMIDEDIHALCYVVDGDWIYYSETGYLYNNEDRFDKDDAGIYKIKTDGSEKEKLMDLDVSDEDFRNNMGSQFATSLSVYKNKLYFIDNTDPWDNRLCRMDLDGENVEEVSSGCAYEYTIDTKTDKLYYMEGIVLADNLDTDQRIMEVSLKDLSEETIGDFNRSVTWKLYLTCNDSKLYINDFHQQFGQDDFYGRKESPAFIGCYYDLKEKEAYGFYTYATYKEGEIKKTPLGVIQGAEIMDKRYYYMDKYENDPSFLEFE